MIEPNTVIVSINDPGESAYVSGTDYEDVLRKIEILREMALEGLGREPLFVGNFDLTPEIDEIRAEAEKARLLGVPAANENT